MEWRVHVAIVLREVGVAAAENDEAGAKGWVGAPLKSEVYHGSAKGGGRGSGARTGWRGL